MVAFPAVPGRQLVGRLKRLDRLIRLPAKNAIRIARLRGRLWHLHAELDEGTLKHENRRPLLSLLQWMPAVRRGDDAGYS